MDPFSEPPSAPISVVIPDAPPKRHTARFIAIAVVAAAVIGGVAFAVTRGDDAPTYSLVASSDSTTDVTSMTFDMTTRALGDEIVGEFELDFQHGLIHFRMDLGSQLEMIFDITNNVTYVNSAFFNGLGMDVPTDWVSMDSDFLAEDGNGSVFDAQGMGNPIEATQMIDSAIKTDEIGFDEVNGVKVKHYQVTFRGEDVFAFNEQLAALFEDSGGDIPAEIVYDFYVDEQNFVRRVTAVLDMGTGELTVDMVVSSINEPVNIEIPADDDVTDVTDTL